jgi:hypothetical protein
VSLISITISEENEGDLTGKDFVTVKFYDFREIFMSNMLYYFVNI